MSIGKDQKNKVFARKPNHKNCDICDGKGHIVKALTDGQGAINGYTRTKCIRCDGKGQVFNENAARSI